MRHYGLVKADGTVTGTGGISDDCLDFPWQTGIKKALVAAGPGLYRFTVVTDCGRVYANLGGRCKSLANETARVSKLTTGRGVARTGSPGVAGFQHCADMSTSSMASTATRNRELLSWLEDQA